MSYVAVGLIPENIPVWAFPGMLPASPVPHRGTGPVGPTMGADIFPKHTRVGDVVNVTGPFAGLIQGQVRVKFEGGPWLSPTLMGPFSASVVVPEGAVTGVCEIEIDGRRVFGTNCVVDPGEVRAGRHGGVFTRGQWTQRGELLSGLGAADDLAFHLGPLAAGLGAAEYDYRAVRKARGKRGARYWLIAGATSIAARLMVGTR
jgi:hypothetical protein